MGKTTLAQLRAHVGRVAASCLAIVIAVAFIVATLSLNASSSASVLKAVGAQYVASDVVVTTTHDQYAYDAEDPAVGSADPLGPLVPALEALPGVGAVSVDRSADVQVRVEGRSGSSYASAASTGTAPQLAWQRVSAGRLPTAAGEVAVSERVGAALGSTVTVSAPAADSEAPPVVGEARVVGVADLGGDPTAGLSGRLFATDAQLLAWGAGVVRQVRIATTDGAGPAEVQERVRELVQAADPDATVTSGEEAAEAVAVSYTGDAESLTSVLLVFGAIAVLVAGLVIANTFAVLLAQRTREMALLRCVGATRAQVGRGVVLEALAVGLLASGAGVGVGAGLAAVVSKVVARTDSPIPLGSVVVPLSAVVVGVLVGTVVTVLAALAPARAATRVAPLAALRPLSPAPVGSRSGVLRLLLGLVVLVPSAAAMVLFAVRGALTPAVGAGAVSFLGFLLLAQRLVPGAVALAGRLVGPVGGVPGRLAAGNALRNPRRTAATATALLIGVTLTTAMVVGASSTRATAGEALEAGYPTDVVVEGSDPIDPVLLQRITDVDGVAAVAPVADAEVSAGDVSFTLRGVEPGPGRGVVRSEQRSPVPAAGQLVLSQRAAELLGVTTGDPVELTGGSGPATLTALLAPGTEQFATTTLADVRRLDASAGTRAAWVRLDDLGDARQSAVVDDVTDVVTASLPSSQVTGVVALRASFDQILTTMLLVVTGLLAVAVLIALIGVGNTLALSVVERRQESGLLRALGLTRGQLRALLAWEALLVAGVAGVLGVALGTGYGLVGTASVLAAEAPVVLDVPWGQIAGIVVVAAAAGALASVLPARRAARTSPVAAIAD